MRSRSRSLRRVGAILAIVVAVSAVSVATTETADAASKVHVYTGIGTKTFKIHKPVAGQPYLATVSFAKKTKGDWYLQSLDKAGQVVTSSLTVYSPWTGTLLIDPPSTNGSSVKLSMITQSTLYKDKWKIVLKPVSSAPVLHSGKSVTGHYGAVYFWNGAAANVTMSWKGPKLSSIEGRYQLASKETPLSRFGWIADNLVSGTSITAAIPAGPLWIEVPGSQASGKGTWKITVTPAS